MENTAACILSHPKAFRTIVLEGIRGDLITSKPFFGLGEAFYKALFKMLRSYQGKKQDELEPSRFTGA